MEILFGGYSCISKANSTQIEDGKLEGNTEIVDEPQIVLLA